MSDTSTTSFPETNGEACVAEFQLPTASLIRFVIDESCSFELDVMETAFQFDQLCGMEATEQVTVGGVLGGIKPWLREQAGRDLSYDQVWFIYSQIKKSFEDLKKKLPPLPV